jgi:hypothetical protein
MSNLRDFIIRQIVIDKWAESSDALPVQNTADIILKEIEKRIDDWVKESDYDEEVEGCADKLKEMLK